MKGISPKLEARVDYRHHEREGGEAAANSLGHQINPSAECPASHPAHQINPSAEGPVSRQTPKAKEPLRDTAFPMAVCLAVHAMIGGLMHAGYEPKHLPKDRLGTVLQQWEDTETHNADIHERLKQHIEALVDQWINQYMDPSHKDYLGDRSSPESTIIPPEVYLHIDALRQIEHMVRNRRFGDEWTWEDVLEKVATLKAGAMALHEESIKIVLDDTTLTWTCDPLKDFSTYQKGAFLGPNRYFYAEGVPNTDYHPDYWELSSQLLDGAADCKVARSTAMLIRKVYEDKCPDNMDAMNGFRTIGWKDHVHSGYVTPTGQIHTLREGALTHPVVKGTHPKSAIDPGRVLPLSEHFAIYLEKSGLANEPQKQRIRALGLRPDNMGRYSDKPVPPGFRTFASYEAIMEGDDTGEAPDKPRLPEPEGNDLNHPISFKETVINEGMYYIAEALEHSRSLGGGMSGVKWPALMSNEAFLRAILEKDHLKIPVWFYTMVDPRLKEKVLMPWLEEWKKEWQRAWDARHYTSRFHLEEVMLAEMKYGEVAQLFLLDQYAKDPQFVHEWQAAFDDIEKYKGTGAFAQASSIYEGGSYYLARTTGDARYTERLPRMTGEENLDELSPRSIERASEEAITRLADRLMGEWESNPNGLLQTQWKSLLRRLPEDQRYAFLVLILEEEFYLDEFWVNEIHEFVLAYPQRRDEIVQMVWEKLIKFESPYAHTLEGLNLYGKKYPALKIPEGVSVFEKCKAECILTESPFERAYYLKDAEDVPLETMEDFRKLMRPMVLISGDAISEIFSSETFETPNPGLRYKIRKLYRRTADPRERLEILAMQPLLYATTPFIPVGDVYPEDKLLLARYGITDPEWGPGKARMIYAPETISIEEWREYYNMEAEYEGASIFDKNLERMRRLNPWAFERLVMEVIEDEAQ